MSKPEDNSEHARVGRLMHRIDAMERRIEYLEWVAAGEDSWEEWRGAQCPVAPDVLYQARLRDGRLLDPARSRETAWNWNHTGGPSDIVAYRILG